VNTIVLPCDLHWDVTGITKSDSPPLPAVLHDVAGAQFLDRPRRREAALTDIEPAQSCA
jgi:hypothetical protein